MNFAYLVYVTRVKKKSNSPHSGSLFKPGKKPKIVVHAAGDVGISGDGYRWRKYGQKMVKGNPHPRCIPIFKFKLSILSLISYLAQAINALSG